MKKIIIIMIALAAILTIVSCANANDDIVTTENTTTTTPEITGYPSGTVQMPMLYLNGKLYVFDYYCYGGNSEYYEDSESYINEYDLTLIGETKAEQNENPPAEEYYAARLPVGTKIYSDKNGKIFVMESQRMLALKLSSRD